MEKKASELRKAVERLLSQAQEADRNDDSLHVKGKREKDLPEMIVWSVARRAAMPVGPACFMDRALMGGEANEESVSTSRAAHNPLDRLNTIAV